MKSSQKRACCDISLSLELRNYMKSAHPGMEISKPGYLKQRMKLAEDIIRDAEAEMDEKETQKNRISCSSRFMKTLAKIWFQ